MSLLLDALRRAAATREDPGADRYTVPRRAGVLEPEPPAPEHPLPDERPPASPEAASPEMGTPATLRPGIQSPRAPLAEPRADDLALVPPDEPLDVIPDVIPEEPRDDLRHEPRDELRAHAPTATPRTDYHAAPDARERATADALLQMGAAGRRGRGRLLLGLTTATLLAGGALAGGGWLWYQQSRAQVADTLGAYRPQVARARMATTSSPAAERKPTASTDSAAGTAPSPSGSGAGVGAQASRAAPAIGSPGPATQGQTTKGQAASGQTAPASDTKPGGQSAETTPAAEPPAPRTAASLGGANPGSTDGGGAESSPAAADTTAVAKADGADASADDGAPAAAQAETRAETPAAVETTNAEGAASTAVETAEAGTAAPDSPQPDSTIHHSRADSRTPSAAGPDDATTAPPRQARPLVQVASRAPLADVLERGYRALRAGRLAAADIAYGQALRMAPENRDALLGVAVVRQRQGATVAARQLYQRVLAAYPRDPYARAALTALNGDLPRRDETELEMLLRETPHAPALNFALGNLYAAESRWAEARQAYTRAAEAAPGDSDYAYNLAVALDHLGRHEDARRLYAKALRLTVRSAPAFDPGAARRRIRQLR